MVIISANDILLIFFSVSGKKIRNLSSTEYSQRVVIVKDKPYLCMCGKKGLIPKVIKRFKAHYGFKHQNWLTFFSHLFGYANTHTLSFYYRLSRSTISVNNRVQYYSVLICSYDSHQGLKILRQTVSYD